MSGNLGDMVQSWNGMRSQAAEGELFVEPELANALFKACQRRIEELRLIREQADELTKLSGFGDFESAKGLQRKFERKAVDLVAILSQHIDIVTAMRDTYRSNLAALATQDVDTAAILSRIERGGVR